MKDSESAWNDRVTRLRGAVGPVEVTFDSTLAAGPLIAAVSSRLGHAPELHRHVCQFLCRSLIDCRHRGASLLVASGSAIEPWAVRAAELFAVPIVKLAVNRLDPSAAVVVRSTDGQEVSRDAAVMAWADRVDAVFVRRGGTVHRCLQARVADRADATTRVAVSMLETCAAPGLITSGAIGWFCTRNKKSGIRGAESCGADPFVAAAVGADDQWTRSDGQWLIHCTRGPAGAWPGETERQYRDSILLGDESSIQRGPLDALERILRSGRIVASAVATTKNHPVVCFSALPLYELLQRRCFRPQLSRWDYEPYGIAIRLAIAKQMGIQPVIYGDPKSRSMLSPQDQFRFHPSGKTFDWREEREWRSSKCVELGTIDPNDIRVFAADDSEARSRLQACRWPVTFVAATPRKRPPAVTKAGKQL